MNSKVLLGDCLELLRDIPNNSIDMIFTDLPFGTSAARWDTVLDLEKLFFHYRRIIKERSAIVLFCQQPFTTRLISSAIDIYRYSWIWRKNRSTGFLDAKRRPLNSYEEIAVFGLKSPSYYPQMREGKPHTRSHHIRNKKAEVYHDMNNENFKDHTTNLYYPDRILEFPIEIKPKHPTQKPISLLQYLIKTYTNEGDTVLDSCSGSGSTLVAAKLINRNYIGMELDENYYNMSVEWLNELS